jgi:hypothetical protein
MGAGSEQRGLERQRLLVRADAAERVEMRG